ncbi:hypothetical protein BGZ72_002086 [Mortierella alpina]|nr:hypothetical protein BGZ72_002086 [Mortierella alpina]
MSFAADNKDKKQAQGHIANAVTPEQEREMFGQQSPYATSNEHSTAGAPSAYAGPPSVHGAPPSVHGAPPSVYAAPPSARPSSAAAISSSPAPAANPQTQDLQSPARSHGPQAAAAIDTPSTDEPPPSYEEVARSRAPQNQYGDSPNQEGYTSPSAPLLAENPTSGYSSIAIPPPRPSSLSPSYPDRARRFNKFWLLFFVVIVVLLLMDDGDPSGGEDECNRRPRYTKTLTELALSPSMDDFTLNVSNMVGLVTVEQAPQDDASPMARLLIEGSALDREDVGGILPNVRQIGATCVVSVSHSERSTVDCVRATVKILLPASTTTLKRIRMSISEGNLTISLLDPLQPQRIQVQDMDTKVITGHSNIRANVLSWARLGGSVGTITGKILVGKELQVAMVDGSVALDLAQSQESDVIEAKVEVMNGEVKVDMVTPYQGTFKLETNNGVTKVDPDPARTHFTSLSNKSIRGWNSITGKEPGSPASALKLTARNGDVELSMARVEL